MGPYRTLQGGSYGVQRAYGALQDPADPMGPYRTLQNPADSMGPYITLQGGVLWGPESLRGPTGPCRPYGAL